MARHVAFFAGNAALRATYALAASDEEIAQAAAEVEEDQPPWTAGAAAFTAVCICFCCCIPVCTGFCGICMLFEGEPVFRLCRYEEDGAKVADVSVAAEAAAPHNKPGRPAAGPRGTRQPPSLPAADPHSPVSPARGEPRRVWRMDTRSTMDVIHAHASSSLPQPLRRELLGEGLFVLFYAFVALPLGVAAAATAGFKDIPWWTQPVVCAPLLLRMMLSDVYFVRRFKKQEGDERATIFSLMAEDVMRFCCCRRFRLPFVMSKLEAVDSTTDGLAIISVILLQRDEFWRARFALGWFSAPIVAPAILDFTLPVLMVATLLASTAVQLFHVASPTMPVGVHAELAGLGLLADRAKQEMDEHHSRGVQTTVTVARVVFEAAPQLVMQGSAVMAAGTPLADQPILLISMFCSTAVGMAKAGSMLRALAGLVADEKAHHLVLSCSFIVPTCTVASMCWGLGRVLLAQSCQSLMWDITSGCVEVPDALLPS